MCSWLAYNGPAIKGVCVAERVEAGAVKPNRGRVPAPARAERLKIALWAILAKEPVCGLERSMPCPDEAKRRRRRGFWSYGTKLRAYTSVAVQTK